MISRSLCPETVKGRGLGTSELQSTARGRCAVFNPTMGSRAGLKASPTMGFLRVVLLGALACGWVWEGRSLGVVGGVMGQETCTSPHCGRGLASARWRGVTAGQAL